MLQVVWKKKTFCGTEKKILQVSDLGPDLEGQLYSIVEQTSKRLIAVAVKKNGKNKK